jgi:hypothetical protein
VGIDKAGQDQARPVVYPAGLWVAGAQIVGGTEIGDLPVPDQDRATGFVMRHVRPALERIPVKAQNLP